MLCTCCCKKVESVFELIESWKCNLITCLKNTRELNVVNVESHEIPTVDDATNVLILKEENIDIIVENEQELDPLSQVFENNELLSDNHVYKKSVEVTDYLNLNVITADFLDCKLGR